MRTMITIVSRLRAARSSSSGSAGFFVTSAASLSVANVCLLRLISSDETDRSLCDGTAPDVGGNGGSRSCASSPPGGVDVDAEGSFHGIIPARQLWWPRASYPLWDYNWDGKEPPSSGGEEKTSRTEDAAEAGNVAATASAAKGRRGPIEVNDAAIEPSSKDGDREKFLRDEGVTRHVILVRHGQYDETHREDERRKLTDLGRRQADLTGRRLAEMMRGVDETFGPCDVEVVRVSDMVRAKETAEIIARHLPGVAVADPDPLLNEGIPAQIIPVRPEIDTEKEMDENHDRIEEAFQKYFWRADQPEFKPKSCDRDCDAETNPHVGSIDDPIERRRRDARHRFEVIVGHGNVIRYFFCRALQLPPEAWLRLSVFNCSCTYLMIKPNGTVSCRLLGDIGHLGHDHTSFSMYHGLAWS